MAIWHATNDAVEHARKAGTLTDADDGAVEVLLRMAERMDDPDFPVIDGKFDNVTESLYFKACDALGLTPAGRAKLGEKGKGGGGGKLAQLRGDVQSLDAKRRQRRTGA